MACQSLIGANFDNLVRELGRYRPSSRFQSIALKFCAANLLDCSLSQRCHFVTAELPSNTDAIKSEAEDKRAHPRSKRDQIVAAAIKVFLENGYKATSMNRVADQAGVIKATIYSHFKDKEQLFIAIIEELTIKKIDLNYEDLEPLMVLSPEMFIEQVSNKFSVLMEDPEYLRLFRLMVGESERFPELASIYVKTVILRGMDLATTYFDRHPELNIADSAAMAHICAGSFVSLMTWQQILGGKKIRTLEVERVTKMLKTLICDGAQHRGKNN